MALIFDFSTNNSILVVKVQSEVSFESRNLKKLPQATVKKLFPEQSEVSTFPAGCADNKIVRGDFCFLWSL